MAYAKLVPLESSQPAALPCVKTAQGRHLATVYTINTHNSATHLQREGGFRLQHLVRRIAKANACSRARVHTPLHTSVRVLRMQGRLAVLATQATDRCLMDSAKCAMRANTLPGTRVQAVKTALWAKPAVKGLLSAMIALQALTRTTQDRQCVRVAHNIAPPRLVPTNLRTAHALQVRKLRLHVATHSVQSLCKVSATHTSTHLHTNPHCPHHAKCSM